MDEKTKATAQGLIAVMVGYWQRVPALTQALLWVMVADVVLGIAVGIKQRQLSRATMFGGVTKKVTILTLMGVAAVLNPHVMPLLGIDLVQAASFFYLAYEITSIVRNAAILDVPVFSQAQDIMKYFQIAGGSSKQKDSKPTSKQGGE